MKLPDFISQIFGEKEEVKQTEPKQFIPSGKGDFYCYPGSQLLINKLDIKDPFIFGFAESKYARTRLNELLENPIQGNFDFEHLKAIHGYIFQDIYEWAGQERQGLNISKETLDGSSVSMFCSVNMIEQFSKQTFDKLKEDNYLQGLDKNSFAEKTAKYLGDINYLHAFREGNGRAQNEFIRVLALNAGYNLDLSLVSRKEFINAMEDSFNNNPIRLEQIIKNHIKPLNEPQLHNEIIDKIQNYSIGQAEDSKILLVSNQAERVVGIPEADFKLGNYNMDNHSYFYPMAVNVDDVKIVFDGKMEPAQIADAFKGLKDNGYEVNVKVMAVSELESRAASYVRYQGLVEQGQTVKVSEHSHETVFYDMAKSLEKIEADKSFSNIEVLNRNNDVVFKNSIDNPQVGVVKCLEDVRNKPWSIEKYQEFVNQNEIIIDKMVKRGEDSIYINDLKSINKDSFSMLDGHDRDIMKQINEIKANPVSLDSNSYLDANSTYNAYANLAMKENNGVWSVGKTDEDVAKLMLGDGARTLRVQEVLLQSPSFNGLSREQAVMDTASIIKRAEASLPSLEKSISMKFN